MKTLNKLRDQLSNLTNKCYNKKKQRLDTL